MSSLQIPPGFRYRDVLRKGRPVHAPFDAFSIRHPAMPLSRRAKIFSPFDALKGFNEAIREKDILYVPRRELNEEDRARLDRTVAALRKLTRNSRVLRDHPVFVAAETFVPRDRDDAGCRIGRYEEVRGLCEGVDTVHRVIKIAGRDIPADHIAALVILGPDPE